MVDEMVAPEFPAGDHIFGGHASQVGTAESVEQGLSR
jgi:hypothetical protein